MPKNTRRKNTQKGITLIALVVTIIVLLILAGISISMLTGNNGILTQAEDAKEETRGASVEEARDLWKINKEADKQTESETAQTLEELINGLVNQKLLTEDEKDQILGNADKEIKATYQVTIGSRTIVFKTKEILAGDVLKTDSTATDAAAKSPYVTYNGLDCRVLYNDETHGLQIITSESVETVTLGYEDTMVTSVDFTYEGTATGVDENFKKAATSYNHAVENLNNKAKIYKDTKGIAKDARCLGSIPTLMDGKFQGDTSELWSGSYDYLTTYGWNNKFQTTGLNYTEDVKQLNDLGLNVSSGWTWLASSIGISSSSVTDISVCTVNSGGNASRNFFCLVHSNGFCSRRDFKFGVPPRIPSTN